MTQVDPVRAYFASKEHTWWCTSVLNCKCPDLDHRLLRPADPGQFGRRSTAHLHLDSQVQCYSQDIC